MKSLRTAFDTALLASGKAGMIVGAMLLSAGMPTPDEPGNAGASLIGAGLMIGSAKIAHIGYKGFKNVLPRMDMTS